MFKGVLIKQAQMVDKEMKYVWDNCKLLQIGHVGMKRIMPINPPPFWALNTWFESSRWYMKAIIYLGIDVDDGWKLFYY